MLNRGFNFRQMIRISTFYFSGHASRRSDPIRSDGTNLLEGCARGAETPRQYDETGGVAARSGQAIDEADFWRLVSRSHHGEH
jgi:hypothetical protein